MNNFRFYNPCEIYFGKEQEKNAGKLCAKYGHKVLMVYGKNSIKKNGVYDTVISSFKEENIEFIELNGVKPNPEMDLVYKGIEICKNENIDLYWLLVEEVSLTVPKPLRLVLCMMGMPGIFI